MSFKTDRLAALFPDAYAAREGASLLRRLLDAVGLEHMRADQSVKALLKSHWVDYAQGDALDGLAALFSVERRQLPSRPLPDGTVVPGGLEPDEPFRRRLKSVVDYFTGGGTVKAIQGAVRSALGLPYDLDLFLQEIAGPGGDPTGRFTAFLQAIEDLVQVHEFSPKGETVLSEPVVRTAESRSEVTVEVGFSSVLDVYPRIEWTFTTGGGRRLTVQRLDSTAGVRSRDSLMVRPGQTLVLSAGPDGALSASIGTTDVSDQFTAWDGSSAPLLPKLPGVATQWKFTAQAALFGISGFDDPEGFDSPDFSVRMGWTRHQPLTFDVIVPYFIDAAVKSIPRPAGYQGDIFTFEGLPLEVIQKVVDQTRAAGVKGMVHFSLNFAEDHAVLERAAGLLQQRNAESQQMSESVVVGSLETAEESQPMDEAFAIGGVFDVSAFERGFGFH